MKNLFKYLTLFIVLLPLSSCKIDTKSKLFNARALKASCDIHNISLSQLECIEFYPEFIGDSEELCDEAQHRHFASLKSHRDSNSATYCGSYRKIGSCKLSFHTVFFYEEGYSAGQAQTECNSMNGYFEQ